VFGFFTAPSDASFLDKCKAGLKTGAKAGIAGAIAGLVIDTCGAIAPLAIAAAAALGGGVGNTVAEVKFQAIEGDLGTPVGNSKLKGAVGTGVILGPLSAYANPIATGIGSSVGGTLWDAFSDAYHSKEEEVNEDINNFKKECK